jgi:hypothetical protein
MQPHISLCTLSLCISYLLVLSCHHLLLAGSWQVSGWAPGSCAKHLQRQQQQQMCHTSSNTSSSSSPEAWASVCMWHVTLGEGLQSWTLSGCSSCCHPAVAAVAVAAAQLGSSSSGGSKHLRACCCWCHSRWEWARYEG